MTDASLRLTDLAHGGGCGCKLSPAVLRELLAGMPPMLGFPDLLVGTETGDDAAVYRIDDERALVATTDFFMPIIDDPFDFGRVAAANALSDVYAMGGRPLLALAILGMPLGKIDPAAAGQILAGGAAVCAEAGIPVAGGHSIDAPEPIYGLAVVGMVHPQRVMRNDRARAGDVLILGKPLGVGVIGAALKSRSLGPGRAGELTQTLVSSATRLNAVGPALAALETTHAMTDVTGFGLLGHVLEVCRGSGLCARIEAAGVPLLDHVETLARTPFRTGAAVRNWASYGGEVVAGPEIEPWRRDLLCDPQTSGGLLVAAVADAADSVLATFRAGGFGEAAVIGSLHEGRSMVHLR